MQQVVERALVRGADHDMRGTARFGAGKRGAHRLTGRRMQHLALRRDARRRDPGAGVRHDRLGLRTGFGLGLGAVKHFADPDMEREHRPPVAFASATARSVTRASASLPSTAATTSPGAGAVAGTAL
ncbi:hypothetical protein SDC9_19901 [bioreactor metagenome]|uniref:Uncharacterized protein n=1 Tax=bioreactor metagenome TaxID=1076179 RepID=A0A644U597_9ZZZZ